MSQGQKNKKFPIKYTPNLFAGFPVCLISVGNNLSTVSMIQVFSYRPLRLGVGIDPKSKTYELIQKKKKFIINFLTTKMIKPARVCGTVSGWEVSDKYSLARLTREEFRNQKCVKESPVKIFCEVVNSKRIGNRHWFFVRIKDIKLSSPTLSKSNLLYFGDGVFGYVKKIADF